LAKKAIDKKNIIALVLMAGKGKRMKSEIPKVLHRIAGLPMGYYVLKALDAAGIKNRFIVTGFGAEMVENEFKGEKFIRQEPQKGTGHAVLTARGYIPKNITHILIINGDTPLLTPNSIRSVISLLGKTGCKAVISCDWKADPFGLGRIITDEKGNFKAIKEEKDCNKSERNIEWVNVGLYGFEKEILNKYLDKLTNKNKQKELYLTDIPVMILKNGGQVEVYMADDDSFLVMPNDRKDIAQASMIIQNRLLNKHMENGVTIIDPCRTYIDFSVKIASDVIIHPDTYLKGKTTIDKYSEIGPSVTIQNSRIGSNVRIQYSVIDEARIDDECRIGPYSRIRPKTRLKKGVRIGNFCEIKKSTIGEDARINHLSYIGDATIGKRVNIGAGTITCNFDGKKKYKTIIGDGAFIGSDSILVAPLKIGAGTKTGAGSVITRDVPGEHLVMGVPARVIRKLDKDEIIEKKDSGR